MLNDAARNIYITDTHYITLTDQDSYSIKLLSPEFWLVHCVLTSSDPVAATSRRSGSNNIIGKHNETAIVPLARETRDMLRRPWNSMIVFTVYTRWFHQPGGWCCFKVDGSSRWVTGAVVRTGRQWRGRDELHFADSWRKSYAADLNPMWCLVLTVTCKIGKCEQSITKVLAVFVSL